MSGINAVQRINAAINVECDKPQGQRKMLALNGIHNAPSIGTQKAYCPVREVYDPHNRAAACAVWDVVLDVVASRSPGAGTSKRGHQALVDTLKDQVFDKRVVLPTVLDRMTAMGALYAAIKRVIADGGVDAEKANRLVSASSRLSDEIRGIADAVVISKSKSGGYTGSKKDKPLLKAMQRSAELMTSCVDLVGVDRLAGAILDEVVTPHVVTAIAAKRPDDFEAMMTSAQAVDVTPFMNGDRVRADAAVLSRQLRGCAEAIESGVLSALKIPAYVKGNYDRESAKPPDGDGSPERAGNGNIAPGSNGPGPAASNGGLPSVNTWTGGNLTTGSVTTGSVKTGSVHVNVGDAYMEALKTIGQLVLMIKNKDEQHQARIDALTGRIRRLEAAQPLSRPSSGYTSDRASIVSAHDEGLTPATEMAGGQESGSPGASVDSLGMHEQVHGMNAGQVPMRSMLDDTRSPVASSPVPSYMPLSAHLVREADRAFAAARPGSEQGGMSALRLDSFDVDAGEAALDVSEISGSGQPQRSTVNARGFGAGAQVPADAESQFESVKDELLAMSPFSDFDEIFGEASEPGWVVEEISPQRPHADVTTSGKEGGDEAIGAMAHAEPLGHSPTMATLAAGSARPSLSGMGAGMPALTGAAGVLSDNIKDARWRNYSELFLNYLVPPVGMDVDAPLVSAKAFQQYNALCDASSDAVVNAQIKNGTMTLKGGALTSRGLSEADMSVWKARGREGAARMATPLPSPSELRIHEHLAVKGLTPEEVWHTTSGKVPRPVQRDTADAESSADAWEGISAEAYKADPWVKHRLSRQTGETVGQPAATVFTTLPPRRPLQRPQTLSFAAAMGSSHRADDASPATSTVQRAELPQRMIAEAMTVDSETHVDQPRRVRARVRFDTIDSEVPDASPATSTVQRAELPQRMMAEAVTVDSETHVDQPRRVRARVRFDTIDSEVPMVSRFAAESSFKDELEKSIAKLKARRQTASPDFEAFALGGHSPQPDMQARTP